MDGVEITQALIENTNWDREKNTNQVFESFSNGGWMRCLAQKGKWMVMEPFFKKIREKNENHDGCPKFNEFFSPPFCAGKQKPENGPFS